MNRFLTIAFILCSRILFAQSEINDSIQADSCIIVKQTMLDNPSKDFYFQIWDNYNIRYYNIDKSQLKNKTLVIKIDSTDKFTYPLKINGKVLSKYGPRRGRMHTGTDLKLNLNDTVMSVFDGRVRIAKVMSGYGKMVVIRHNNGLETLNSHLNKILVQPNDDVKSGDAIGLGGRTGRATTEHLHFETRILGTPFDSQMFIDFCEERLITDSLFFQNDKIEISANLFPNTNEHTPDFDDESCFDNEVGNQPIYYEVKKGDTLYKIANKYNTTIDDILKLNKLKKSSTLSIGQSIRIK